MIELLLTIATMFAGCGVIYVVWRVWLGVVCRVWLGFEPYVNRFLDRHDTIFMLMIMVPLGLIFIVCCIVGLLVTLAICFFVGEAIFNFWEGVLA